MGFRKLATLAILPLALTFAAVPLFAQGPFPEAPVPNVAVQSASSFVATPKISEPAHKFWDRRNKILFGAAAALNTADFLVTRANLQSGGNELNPVVRIFGRSTSALALNFAGETAGTMSLSYFFHKTGHHKMEHVVTYVNIGSSAGAVSYGLAHR